MDNRRKQSAHFFWNLVYITDLEMKIVSDKAENFVKKGENAGYQHFPLFPTMFSKYSFIGVVKTLDCAVKD